MGERRDKSNKKFMLLSAIGIFMVVDHHTFTAFNLFGDIIPYNSFFMPMFVFISGYFNKVDRSTNLLKYFTKKIKTLLVPYIGLSLTVFTLQQLINYIKLGDQMDALPSDYLSYVINRILTIGSFGAIVEPMWFVITLFAALMIYAVLKKFLYRIWNSYLMFGLFCCLQFLVVYLAKNTDPESISYFLVPLKSLFFFPFLELGIIYREHLEKKHSEMSGGGKVALLALLLLINTIRTVYLPYAYDVAFDSIDDLSGFNSPYFVTPLISSLVGILFWLTLTDLISKKIYESRFINYMSCNTFWIMGLHIVFYNIFNCLLMVISEHIAEIPYFDVEAFKGSEWYFWEIGSNIKVIYVMIGVLGPLGLKLLYDRIKSFASTRIKKALIIILLLLISGAVIFLTRPGTSNIEYEPAEQGNETASVETDPVETDPAETDPVETNDTESEVPVYAYLDLAYEVNGTSADYLTEPCAIYGDGTHTITINRSDNDETAIAINGLSYMGIRLIDDEMSDVDISDASISDIEVKCDGITLRIDETGTISNEDGGKNNFFDCYDMEADMSEATVYDFSGKKTIEVSFTISGTGLIYQPEKV